MALMPTELTQERLRNLVQDANLSFLIGAGASAPMFRLLGDIELLMTSIDDADLDDDARAYGRASIYSSFFRSVIQRNRQLLDGTGDGPALLKRYEVFLQVVNRILIERRSSILNKQVNLFTTNIDLAVEVAGEALQINLNDGFTGRLHPRFSTSNFGSVVSRRSLQYDNLSEIPTFNLLKLHGSVNWLAETATKDRSDISLDLRLDRVESTAAELEKVDAILADVDQDTTAETLLGQSIPRGVATVLRPFLQAYDELAIVNPSKTKFRQTVLNQNYYDLLRIFSNELEKENSALFVLGFSCRDEHIRELMVRAARTNPTLQIVIFAYNAVSATEIAGAFDGYPITNSNICIAAPPDPLDGEDRMHYDLPTLVSEFFDKVVPDVAAHKQGVEVTLSVREPLVVNP